MPTVAMIEPDWELARLMRDVFAWEGWDVLELHPECMWEALSRHRPDLILLEPWLDSPEAGWPILERLCADPATRSIPIVLWTGAIDRIQPRRAWLAERDIPVIAKPFEIDDLLSLIRDCLSADPDT